MEQVLDAPMATGEHVVVGGFGEGLVADVVAERPHGLACFLEEHLGLHLGDGFQSRPTIGDIVFGNGFGGKDPAGPGLDSHKGQAIPLPRRGFL